VTGRFIAAEPRKKTFVSTIQRLSKTSQPTASERFTMRNRHAALRQTTSANEVRTRLSDAKRAYTLDGARIGASLPRDRCQLGAIAWIALTVKLTNDVRSGACPVAIARTRAMASAAHRVINSGPDYFGQFGRVRLGSILDRHARTLEAFERLHDQSDLPQVATG
jgi:hypothetical protein